MLKGSKEAFTVLLITFLIFNWFSIWKKFWKAETWTFPNICNAMYVEGVKRSLHSFTHNFLNIQLIFNLKKVLESWDLDLSKHMQCYVCWRGQKLFWLFTPSTCFNIHSIGGMVGKVQVSAFQNFFGLKISWILRKLWVKMLWALTAYFWGALYRVHFRPFRHE